MGSQNQSLDEAMRAHNRVHLSLIPLATLVSPLLCQLKFNGGVSSSSNSNSPSANRNTNRPTNVDEKFFFGGDTPSLTGNQALDGGIVGLGLGALGAAVLGPTIQGALNGGQQSQGFNSCGRRRRRQANFGGSQTSSGGSGGGGQEIDGEERFFLPTGQGCTCNTNGRRRRQAPGEDEPGTRFFGGLFGGQQPKSGVQQPGVQQPEPGVQQPKPGSVPVRLQPHLPRPEREHTRCLPEKRQHWEDVVLHHRQKQQLWRPAELQEVPKQPLVLQRLQQSRLMRDLWSDRI